MIERLRRAVAGRTALVGVIGAVLLLAGGSLYQALVTPPYRFIDEQAHAGLRARRPGGPAAVDRHADRRGRRRRRPPHPPARRAEPAATTCGSPTTRRWPTSSPPPGCAHPGAGHRRGSPHRPAPAQHRCGLAAVGLIYLLGRDLAGGDRTIGLVRPPSSRQPARGVRGLAGLHRRLRPARHDRRCCLAGAAAGRRARAAGRPAIGPGARHLAGGRGRRPADGAAARRRRRAGGARRGVVAAQHPDLVVARLAGRAGRGDVGLVLRAQRRPVRGPDRVRRPAREVRPHAVGLALVVADQKGVWESAFRTIVTRRLEAPLPGDPYGWYQLALVIVVAGVVRDGRAGDPVRRPQPRHDRDDRSPRHGWAGVAMVSLVPVLLVAQHRAGGGAPHPRYLLPMLPVVAVAVALAAVRLATRWAAHRAGRGPRGRHLRQTRASATWLAANLTGPPGSELVTAYGSELLRGAASPPRRPGWSCWSQRWRGPRGDAPDHYRGPFVSDRRIALVPPRYGPDVVGGAELVLREVAHGLAARGWQVDVLTTCARDHYTWANHYPAATTRRRRRHGHPLPGGERHHGPRPRRPGAHHGPRARRPRWPSRRRG